MVRKTGRPKLKSDERRSAIISTRCTPAEFTAIAKRAEACEMDVGEYLRHIALKGKVNITQGKELDFKTFTELKRQGVELHRWGNNLNQIAHELNKHQKFPNDSLDRTFDSATGLCDIIELLLRDTLEKRGIM